MTLAVLANLWSWVRSPRGLALTVFLLVLCLVGAAYLKGRGDGVHAEKTAEAARLKAAQKVIAKREAKASAITQAVAGKTEAARVEIRYRTKTLIEKVPTYVTPASDAQCVVPVGFVQLHDAAAAGLPRPAGGPDETPSGVQLSTVAETVIGNYGVAYDWRAEALAWREWYPKVRAAYEGRNPAKPGGL